MAYFNSEIRFPSKRNIFFQFKPYRTVPKNELRIRIRSYALCSYLQQ